MRDLRPLQTPPEEPRNRDKRGHLRPEVREPIRWDFKAFTAPQDPFAQGNGKRPAAGRTPMAGVDIDKIHENPAYWPKQK